MKSWIRSFGIYFDISFFYVWIVHSIVTLIGDSYIFNGSTVFNNLEYYVIKFMVFIAIFIFWQTVGWFIKRLRDKDVIYTLYTKHFFIYFTVMFVFLLLVWPGVWRSDDIIVFNAAKNLQIEYWQHFITTVFDVFSLMILPFPAGIVVVQIFVISNIVAYIITKGQLILSKSKLLYLVYIPLFSPVIIDSNLFPLRLGLYSFILLLFIFELYYMRLQQREITWRRIVVWSFLISVLATWRSEAVYYAYLAPFIILLLFAKKVSFRKVIILLMISITLTSLMNSFQEYGIKKQTKNAFEYKLTAIAEPMAALLKLPLAGKNVDEHLANIDRVVNVELMKKYSSGAVALFYHDGIRKEFNSKDYNNMMKSYIYLSLHNLGPMLENRMKNFGETSGFKKIPNSTILNSSELTKLVAPYDQNPMYKEFVELPLNSPPSESLRERVIKILEFRSIDNYYLPTPFYYVFYNVMPSILMMIYFIFYYLFKRNWGMVSTFILISGSLPIIFLTAPAPYFMYYQPFYLFTYVFVFFFAIIRFSKVGREFKSVI